MSVTELYNHSIRPLPAADRLQLAKLILNDIPAQLAPDVRDEWSDEDLGEFSRAGWQGATDVDAGGH